jgi:hypothetical protein
VTPTVCGNTIAGSVTAPLMQVAWSRVGVTGIPGWQATALNVTTKVAVVSESRDQPGGRVAGQPTPALP